MFSLIFFQLALAALLPYHRKWTGGRVVECTALEMRRTCKGIVGSNPTLSANKKAPKEGGFFIGGLGAVGGPPVRRLAFVSEQGELTKAGALRA
jgi:hypothetical protein